MRSDPSARGGAVCLGLTTLDVIHRVAEPPVWGRKDVSESTELAAGGPAANAAVTAAALLPPGTVTLVTALGTGPAAQVARADLEAHGVHLLDCAPPGWELPVASAVIDRAGERTVLSPGARTSTLTLTERAADAVRRSRGLLLDGHHPAAARQALELAGRRSRPVDERPVTVLDPGSAKPYAEAWLADIDVAAGSADYAAGLGLSLPAALAHLLAAGAGFAIITDGAGAVRWGAPAAAGPTSGTITPPTVRALDTLGAGDAFHGALLAALVLGADPVAATRRAAVVASARVGVPGARQWLRFLPPPG